MNVPNQLTISRFVLTLAFLVAVFVEFPLHVTVSLLLFSAASLTDYFDGRIARRDKLITNFGILMDPLADKVLVCSAFIAFVESTHLNPGAPVKVAAWMVIIIVARELAITGMRLLAASKKTVLAADNLGKLKTVFQIVTIIALLITDATNEWSPWLQNVFQPWVPGFAQLALWVTVVLTAVSGLIYLWRNRALYLSDT